MGPRQPIAQVVCGLIGCAAVERHERGRHARTADDVRAPAIRRDADDFDEIEVPPNGFFVTMNGCAHVLRYRIMYASQRHDQAKRPTKVRPQARGRRLQAAAAAKYFWGVGPSTGKSRIVHNFSTRPFEERWGSHGEALQVKHHGTGRVFAIADALSEFLLVPVFTGRPR
jgi:hypothetical protein